MRPVKIDLVEEQIDILDSISRLRDQPVDELVREAIDLWLEAQGSALVVDEDWARRLGVLLERRRRRAEQRGWSQEESDAAAVEAVRDVRMAQRNQAARRP